MQAAGTAHLFQVAFQPADPLVDQATINFDLAFTRTTHETETAALPFQMGPASHQPGSLIGQRRQFHLQHPFMGTGTGAENFQNQTGTINDLGF